MGSPARVFPFSFTLRNIAKQQAVIWDDGDWQNPVQGVKGEKRGVDDVDDVANDNDDENDPTTTIKMTKKQKLNNHKQPPPPPPSSKPPNFHVQPLSFYNRTITFQEIADSQATYSSEALTYESPSSSDHPSTSENTVTQFQTQHTSTSRLSHPTYIVHQHQNSLAVLTLGNLLLWMNEIKPSTRPGAGADDGKDDTWTFHSFTYDKKIIAMLEGGANTDSTEQAPSTSTGKRAKKSKDDTKNSNTTRCETVLGLCKLKRRIHDKVDEYEYTTIRVPCLVDGHLMEYNMSIHTPPNCEPTEKAVGLLNKDTWGGGYLGVIMPKGKVYSTRS